MAVLVLESLLWENSLFGDRAIAIRLHVSIIIISFSFFFDDEISLLPLHKISYIHYYVWQSEWAGNLWCRLRIHGKKNHQLP